MRRSPRRSNAARVLGQPRAAGFINAILRRCQREHAQLLRADRSRHRAAHRASALARRCAADGLGRASRGDSRCQQSASAVLDARESAPRQRLRLSSATCGAAASRWPHSMFDDEALLLDARHGCRASCRGSPTAMVSVQDAAAQLGSAICSRRGAGERMLDACAAPGGKTGHLLELQPELAELVAVDVSPERLTRVAREPAAARIVSATLVAGDAAEPADWWDGAAVRPHPARCAVLGDRRDPPPSGHQVAAPARGHRGARGAAVAAVAGVVAVACAGRPAGLCELLGAAGGDRGGRRGISGDSRRRATSRPRHSRTLDAIGRDTPAARACGSPRGQPAWTAFIMLA